MIIKDIVLWLHESRPKDLIDYKIFCFNGVPKYIQVIQDRRTKETIDIFDTAWKHQDFIGLNPAVGPAAEPPARPENLKEMIQCAARISNGLPFARIDMYHINNQIYFGEITFFPASGVGHFNPERYDAIIGDMITLPLNT